MLESNCVCNNDYTGDAMKVTCPRRTCRAKSSIYSRNEQSDDLSNLYCRCGRCGTKFVMFLGFSHIIEEGDLAEIIGMFISELSSDSKKQLIDKLNSLT